MVYSCGRLCTAYHYQPRRTFGKNLGLQLLNGTQSGVRWSDTFGICVMLLFLEVQFMIWKNCWTRFFSLVGHGWKIVPKHFSSHLQSGLWIRLPAYTDLKHGMEAWNNENSKGGIGGVVANNLGEEEDSNVYVHLNMQITIKVGFMMEWLARHKCNLLNYMEVSGVLIFILICWFVGYNLYILTNTIHTYFADKKMIQ